jgi:hypothetical protein
VPSAVDRWYEWDQGVNTGALGSGFFGAECAARWDAEQINMYDEVYLTKIKYYLINPVITYSLRVYQGIAGLYDTLYNHTLQLNLTYNAFDTIDIDPIQLDTARDLWVGYHVDSMAPAHPVATGGCVAIDGYSNMIKIDGSYWTTITAFNPDILASWNIGAYLETPNDTIIYPLFNIYRAIDDGEFVLINSEPYLDTILYDCIMHINADHIYYYITCVYEDGESEPSNIVDVSFVGVDERERPSFNVYPNPARDFVTIQTGSEKSVRYELMNTLGGVVSSGLLAHPSSKVDLSHLGPGIYFLVLFDEGGGDAGEPVKVVKY